MRISVVFYYVWRGVLDSFELSCIIPFQPWLSSYVCVLQYFVLIHIYRSTFLSVNSYLHIYCIALNDMQIFSTFVCTVCMYILVHPNDKLYYFHVKHRQFTRGYLVIFDTLLLPGWSYLLYFSPSLSVGLKRLCTDKA